jgi:hypothetical protein
MCQGVSSKQRAGRRSSRGLIKAKVKGKVEVEVEND